MKETIFCQKDQHTTCGTLQCVYVGVCVYEECFYSAGVQLQQPGIKPEEMNSVGDEAASQFTMAAKSLQSCPTLCDPTDGSPPGSPVPGILQARTLEWVAISFNA